MIRVIVSRAWEYDPYTAEYCWVHYIYLYITHYVATIHTIFVVFGGTVHLQAAEVKVMFGLIGLVISGGCWMWSVRMNWLKWN